MTVRGTLFVVLLAGVFSLCFAAPTLAAGILGFQPGDRSAGENDARLKEAIETLRLGIKEADKGDATKSVEHGKVVYAALKEIGSEGWDGRRQRSLRSIRLGIRAAKKGNTEETSSAYQYALKQLDGLKYGDMNCTHEPMFGLGGSCSDLREKGTR
jgi:hypothetical protein